MIFKFNYYQTRKLHKIKLPLKELRKADLDSNLLTLGAKWLIALHNYLKDNPSMVIKSLVYCFVLMIIKH